MERIVEKNLNAWKSLERRKPLLVRGARQVGKTFSVRKFGKELFNSFVEVDLERNRNWHKIFESDSNPQRIISELEVITGQKIIPGETLLFFDEIQSCSKAITALRYFYEELPQIHIIAAGSLLEFALEHLSFPVGRVQFLEMHPMNFVEYLWAIDKKMLADIVCQKPEKVSGPVHNTLMEELRNYFFIGGMPETVKVYLKTRSIYECFGVHKELCETFRQDFAKYAPRSNSACLDAVFSSLSRSVGKQIKYSQLSRDFSHPTIKNAFDLFCKARIIKKVSSTVPGLPLGAKASARKFKAIMVDIGLWQYLSGMRFDVEFQERDLLSIYNGEMAEQFVGQELMVSQQSELYYWSRDSRGSSAEVDYLIADDNAVFPIEVKSGSSGRMRSLHMLLEQYPECRKGIIFSSASYAELPEQRLLFLPLYYAGGKFPQETKGGTKLASF